VSVFKMLHLVETEVEYEPGDPVKQGQWIRREGNVSRLVTSGLERSTQLIIHPQRCAESCISLILTLQCYGIPAYIIRVVKM
jgi:hypothetical protein